MMEESELEAFIYKVINGGYQALTDNQEIQDATKDLKAMIKIVVTTTYDEGYREGKRVGIYQDNYEIGEITTADDYCKGFFNPFM